MSNQRQPKFKAGTVFDKYALAIDEDGIAWWIDPEAHLVNRAYPGDPLERDYPDAGRDVDPIGPSEFSDYQRQ